MLRDYVVALAAVWAMGAFALFWVAGLDAAAQAGVRLALVVGLLIAAAIPVLLAHRADGTPNRYSALGRMVRREAPLEVAILIFLGAGALLAYALRAIPQTDGGALAAIAFVVAAAAAITVNTFGYAMRD